MRPRIAITTGEPAGIGPEIAAAALHGEDFDADIALIGDHQLLAARARSRWPAAVSIEHIPLNIDSTPGVLDVRNARYVLATLDRAIEGALAGDFDAIVTAPVQKSVINDAAGTGATAFTGHTEYLAERCGVDTVVMMLAGDTAAGPLRVALATTHLPLSAVAQTLSASLLDAVLRVLLASLHGQFGIQQPRVAVTGLNPHAGERGHLGREEIEIIQPAIERARAAGHRITGPVPADTIFVPSVASHFDAVLAMFHDQGLPVLKYATFGHGINITLGLPFIRTSVDHGTALDLAGSGRADAGSMRAAIRTAIELAKRQARR